MALLIVLLLILAAWQVSGQRQRIRELEDRLRRLEGWAAAADAAKEAERLAARPLPPPAWRGSTDAPPLEAGTVPSTQDTRPDPGEVPAEVSPAAALEPILRNVAEPVAAEQEPVVTRSQDEATTTASAPSAETLWRRLERQLIENGTGILGVVVLVAGITFLVVNLALRFGPLPRFLLTQAVAAGLIAPSLIWHAPGRWRPLSLWLRSGGAALALFACLAGGGMPQVGLQWVDDPLQSLLLALAGMALNLLLAVLTRRQTVASLHVLVNLVPLALVRQDVNTLWIACLVGLCGQALPRGRPWDRHRVLVNAGYTLFQLSWIAHSATALDADAGLRLEALLAAALMFGCGLLLLQDQGQGQRLPPWRLAALISGWTGLALTVLVVPLPAAWRAIALLVLAAAALLLARRARRIGSADLHLGQLLISQGLVMAALFSLEPLVVDALLVNALLLVECVLFLRLGLRGQPPAVARLGWVLVAAMAMLMLVQATIGVTIGVLLTGSTPLPVRFQHAGLLIGAGILLGCVSQRLELRGVPVPLPPLLGWLAGALVFLAPAMVPPAWRPLLALGGMGGLLLLERRHRPSGLGRATALAVGGAHLASWLWLLMAKPAAGAVLGQLLPLTGLAVATRGSTRRGLRRSLALDLVGMTAGLAALLLLPPVSPLLPGVAWLVLSLVALLASNHLQRREVNHGLAVGLGYLLLFIGAFVLVIGPSSTLVELGGLAVRARLLIALLGLTVLLGWWLVPPSHILRRALLWRLLHPWFVECLLLGTLVTVAMEVEAPLRPLAWSLLALALLSRPARRWLAPRLGLYAVFTYWLAILATLGQLGAAAPPGTAALAPHAVITLLEILVQVLFALLCRRWLPSDALIDPGGCGLLAWIGAPLARHTHRWLLYPLFVTVALHLAHRYDAALLTLLWALEAFAIFTLGVVLRDSQFRLASLLALGACLLRLVSIDMAQADPVLRGLVFVGVGLLMVGMNAISTRFRDRFGG